VTARRLLGGLFVLNAAVIATALAALPREAFVRMAILNLGEVAVALLATLAFVLAARDPRERALAPAFLALGAGCASWAVGQAIWSWYELVLRIESPFPSAADAGFLLALPLLAVGVALWPRQTRRFGKGELVDAALVAGVAGLFSLDFVIAPIVQSLDGFSLEGVILLAYPLADLVLLTVVIGGMLLQGWAERGRLLVVSAALFALVFADTYFSLVGGDYVTGDVADLGWTTAFAAAGMAAVLPHGWRAEVARIRAEAIGAVLTGSLALFAGLEVLEIWRLDHVKALDTFGIGLLLVLLVARTSHSARVRAREAEVLARAQFELARAYAVRDGALEASRTGVCVFGSEGEARFANSAFVALLGPARAWDAFVSRVGRLAGDGQGEPGQSLQVWSEDGRFISLAFAPLPTGELLATVDDLTDQQRERELRGRLIAETVAAQERESRRIGELLHDDAVQQLTALGLRLELEAQRSGTPALSVLATDCGAIISSLRRLLVDLHPAVLESQGLTAAIEGAADTLRSHGIEVVVRPFALRLAPEPERLVYRLVQEALSNVLKHSAATHVEVQLTAAKGSLRCRISDDGRGFEPDRLETAVKDGHLGLHIVRERVELAGGRLLVESRQGHGTAFSVELPLEPEALPVQVREDSA
jgi:signal transduction histidine kinase